MGTDAPSFDWVREVHASCNASVVFERLKADTHNDVQTRNDLRGESERHYAFRFDAYGDRFFVIREGTPSVRKSAVTFTLEKGNIKVLRDDKDFMTSKPTLNEKRMCVFAVDDRLLESWQFRKEALEDLFFGL